MLQVTSGVHVQVAEEELVITLEDTTVEELCWREVAAALLLSTLEEVVAMLVEELAALEAEDASTLLDATAELDWRESAGLEDESSCDEDPWDVEDAPTALEDTPLVMDVDAADVEDPPMALLPETVLVAMDAAEDPRELADALLPLIIPLLVPVKEKEDPDVDTVEAAPDATEDAPLPTHDGTQRL